MKRVLNLRQPSPSLGLVVVFITGAFLRFYQLGRQGLFLDEAISWGVAHTSLSQIIERTYANGHVPLYFFILKPWVALWGDTHAALRLLGAFFSIGALGLLIFLVARWWSPGAGLYAGWYMAFSSFDVYYAQETRMYTLLGMLWLLSFLLWVGMLREGRRWMPAWAIVNVLLCWTHYYGFFAMGINVGCAFLWWAWHRLRRKGTQPLGSWLGIGTAVSVLGSLPIFVVLWVHRGFEHGGTWLPGLKDLGQLFSLWSVGLTATRERFLDSAHLVLPSLAGVPLYLWMLVGLLTSGTFAAWGLWREWKQGGEPRWGVIPAALLIATPVAFVYAYSVIFGLRMWALRGFIGGAYLYYLWCGIGLSLVRSTWIRRGVAFFVVAVSVASLLPYFTTFQKTDAHRALRDLPKIGEQSAVLLGRAFFAPIAFYYLGESVEVWGLNPMEGGSFNLFRLSAPGVMAGHYSREDCSNLELQRITDLWIYDTVSWRILQEQPHWPACLIGKKLWIYENEAWVSLNH